MTSTRLLALAAVLWTAGVGLLGDSVLLGIVLSVPGFGALGLSARHAVRGTDDSVAPWASCALVPLAFLGVIALANVHLHEFTGGGPGCDVMAHPCGVQPLQGLHHCLSLLAFLTAGIVIGCVVLWRDGRELNPEGRVIRA